MKRCLIAFCAGVVGLLLASVPVAAHHGFFGVVDLSAPITFEGVITTVQWVNPHITFTVDVKDREGKITNWKFVAAGPAAFLARGWSRTDLKTGDRVHVVGYRAKDGTFLAAAGAVTLADGRKLDAASDGVPSLKAK